MTDVVNVGTDPNSGTGDMLRVAFQKVNAEFTALRALAIYNGLLYNNRGAWATATAYSINDLVAVSSIIYVAQVAHNSGTFATDLAAGKWTIHQGVTAAELADPSGAGMIGLDLGEVYASDTVGAFARSLNSLTKYGPLANDGTTDDSAAFLAAAASGAKFIDARGVNCRVSSQINIPSGQTWMLQGATINFTGNTLTVFAAAVVDGFALLGPFTITGDGTTVGTARGISITDCTNWYVDRPILKNIRGVGFYLAPGASTSPRSRHGTINNLRVHECYGGYLDLAGQGAEYCTLINPHITRCTLYGLTTAAGNIIVLGGHIVDNLADGVILEVGGNHGHGGFHGTNINHNDQYNLHARQVLNGHTFSGCHFYANSTVGNGAIFFDRCKGVEIIGGIVDTYVYNHIDGSSGFNRITNVYCPGGYGFVRSIGGGDGLSQLIITGLTGPGAYATGAGGKDGIGLALSEPASVYFLAERASTTQALTSGVSATLLAAAEYFDRRAAYDLATGLFTVPSAPQSMGGLYRVTFDFLFSGTAMNAASSFVDFKLNGVSTKLSLAAISSTTLLQMAGAFDIYLNPGDVLTPTATIVGTTPVFGNATWRSTFAVEMLN